MYNEILWFIFLFFDLAVILLTFRLFGKTGLYFMIAVNIVVANIQVLKTVGMLGLVVTLGNILYNGIFFATDVLNEFYGKKAARRGVWIGFYAMVVVTIVMQIALLFKPDPSDFAHEALSTLFGIMPRIVLGSLTAYVISQMHDVWAYDFWKRFTKGKHLWLRNNASTMVSQLIDTAIFCSIAFLGVWEMNVWWQILLTTYVFKWIVSALDTPFIYLARLVAPHAKEIDEKY